MGEICPTCREEFKGVSRHWSWKESHRPSISDEILDICRGVLMGDGYLHTSSKNASLQIKMVNKEYLEFLDDKFGWLSNGVNLKLTAEEHAEEVRKSGFRSDAKAENYQDVYELCTKCHPDLNVFEKWYDGEKTWPADIELTPDVLTHWYVCDGHWANSGSKDYITISMVNERKNKDKIENMFERSGLPKPSRWGTGEDVCYAAWTAEKTQELHDYMNTVQSFDYKFRNE
jgi:hypothetical protein